MIDPDTIQIIIEGGMVSILLVFGVGVYKLARHLMDLSSTFVNNHLTHLTESLGRVERALTRLDESIERHFPDREE